MFSVCFGKRDICGTLLPIRSCTRICPGGRLRQSLVLFFVFASRRCVFACSLVSCYARSHCTFRLIAGQSRQAGSVWLITGILNQNAAEHKSRQQIANAPKIFKMHQQNTKCTKGKSLVHCINIISLCHSPPEKSGGLFAWKRSIPNGCKQI